MVKKVSEAASASASASLSEEDRRALRGSKFAPLPPTSHQHQHQHQSRPRPSPRLAHPGGPLKTNKAAALAKFLERKLQEPHGLANINPHLIELAVTNAKQTVFTSGSTSTSGRIIRHVSSFDDSDEEVEEEKEKMKDVCTKKQKKKMKKKKKKQKQKVMEE